MREPAGSLRRRAGRSLLVVVAAVAMGACGGGQRGSAVPALPDVVVSAPAGRGLVFDQTAYTATAGHVLIAYRNDDVQTHTLIIEDAGARKLPSFKRIVLGSHKTIDAAADLPAGQYRIVCDIHLPTMVASLTIGA